MAKNVTGNTTLMKQAIIPYGSSDESVLFQDDMKDAPSNGAFKVALPTFDSTNGMLLGAGGWMFDLSALDFNSLENGGQFSFSIEAKGLGDDPIQDSDFTSIGSTGISTTGTSYLCTWANASAVGAAPYGRIFTSSVELIQVQLNGGDTSVSALVTDHTGKDYMIFTISWTGSVVKMFVDNILVKSGTAQTNTDWMQFFHIGTNRGAATAFFEDAVYVKDFVISNRPVMTPVHPSLAKVVIMGDSFANQADTGQSNIPSAGYQNTMTLSAQGYLRELGVGINWSGHGVSGAYIHDWSGVMNDVADQIAGVIADKPSNVVIQAGTNDAGYSLYLEATFETEYQGHLTTLLAGINGKCFIGTVPSLKGETNGKSSELIATEAAAVASINSVINSLPAWWDGANPSDTGRVIVYDLFTETGGEDAAANMMAGTWWSLYDSGGAGVYGNDLHLSSLGRRKFGELVGKTLYENLHK